MFSFLSLSLLSSAFAEPKEYTFDTKASDLYVTVYKNDKTLLSAAAHNHAIRATKWTGKLKWDAEKPEACDIAQHGGKRRARDGLPYRADPFAITTP